MINSLSDAAQVVGGQLHGKDCEFSGISTDTRALSSGELFFALSGPNFDGHEYVAAAAAAGAAGVVVSRKLESDIGQIVVDDVKLALGRFGAAWRASKNVRVVGVTGSNGKTTLKEMIAACLSQDAATFATEGNFNNDIGMPIMLTKIADEHRFAVIEMGANHAGEIAYLVGLANPDVVVITNAGAAHLEGFGSIEGVAHAKGEILQNANRPKVAVLNADDDYFGYWQSLVTDVATLSFGFDSDADVQALNIEAGADGSRFDLKLPGNDLRITLPLPGIHNIRNACAAAAVATALNVDGAGIKAALETVTPVGGRLQPLQGSNGCTLFDDSYNANPLSVIAAAEFLASLPGNNWLVLGDMKELGEDAEELHREVGASARANGVDRLFALGDLAKSSVEAFGEGARWYASIDALIADVESADVDCNVLVKGSRSMQMERVVAALLDDAPVRREA